MVCDATGSNCPSVPLNDSSAAVGRGGGRGGRGGGPGGRGRNTGRRARLAGRRSSVLANGEFFQAAAFLQHTGAEVGETSANGLWTVIEVECLGACGFPTAVQINDRYFENVRPQDVPSILAQLT